MMSRSLAIEYRRQHGAALMVMLIIMLIGISTMLFGILGSANVEAERQRKTAVALAAAKDALIGHAVAYADIHSGEVPGYLPCPDANGGNPEGSAEASCGNQNVSQIGQLPWRTLDIPPPRDGNGECLWYAVSGTYKDNPKTDLMNWDTNGQLQEYDASGVLQTNADNQIVAIVFAPGAVLTGQSRSNDTGSICGLNYNANAYLDNDSALNINNADIASGKFVQAHGDIVNDRFITITRQDIWNAIQKRNDFNATLALLTQRVTECIADYGKHNRDSDNHTDTGRKSLPWPAELQPSSPNYGSNTRYNDHSDIYSGRVPYIVDTSKSTSNNGMTGNLLIVDAPLPGDPPRPTNGLNACPTYKSNPETESEKLYPWWKNWKDHLFYVLSKKYKPSDNSTDSCGDCVSINGGNKYAAIVMFSGAPLTAQQKQRINTTFTNSARGNIGNYLEGRNASNHPNSDGRADYETRPASSTFNDISWCVKTDLSVVTCPAP